MFVCWLVKSIPNERGGMERWNRSPPSRRRGVRLAFKTLWISKRHGRGRRRVKTSVDSLVNEPATRRTTTESRTRAHYARFAFRKKGMNTMRVSRFRQQYEIIYSCPFVNFTASKTVITKNFCTPFAKLNTETRNVHSPGRPFWTPILTAFQTDDESLDEHQRRLRHCGVGTGQKLRTNNGVNLARW